MQICVLCHFFKISVRFSKVKVEIVSVLRYLVKQSVLVIRLGPSPAQKITQLPGKLSPGEAGGTGCTMALT